MNEKSGRLLSAALLAAMGVNQWGMPTIREIVIGEGPRMPVKKVISNGKKKIGRLRKKVKQ